jgi:cyanate permease
MLSQGGAARELIKGKHWRLLTRWVHLNTNKKRQLNQLFALNRRVMKALSIEGEPGLLVELTLWVSAAIFGIGLGGDYMIIPLMTAEIFGIEILGRLLGVILTAGGIAEAAAPWFVGRLRDATGSYSASCFVLVGIALLGGFAVLGLPERKRPL